MQPLAAQLGRYRGKVGSHPMRSLTWQCVWEIDSFAGKAESTARATGKPMDQPIDTLRTAYLTLLRDTIINTIYDDPAYAEVSRSKMMKNWFGRKYIAKDYDPSRRDSGRDWPTVAHSMIGRKRMDNLIFVMTEVLKNNIPGDFIETGVWRGGACIMARGLLGAYGDTTRTVWVADSFEGLPRPDGEKYVADRNDTHFEKTVLAVGLEAVQSNFRRYGLLDDQVKFLKGWFKDTLPAAPIEKLAVLRLDGDMYESTMDGFRALYHKVSPGGYVIVDDYHVVKACRKAVHDFMDANYPQDIKGLQEIDGVGVFWKRG
jgi:O-methyltransferase